jgi:leucyl aminopeptidase
MKFTLVSDIQKPSGNITIIPFDSSLDKFLSQNHLDQENYHLLSEFTQNSSKGESLKILSRGHLYLFISFKDIDTPGLIFKSIRKACVAGKKWFTSNARLLLSGISNDDIYSQKIEAVVLGLLWHNYQIKKSIDQTDFLLEVEDIGSNVSLNDVLKKCLSIAEAQFMAADIVNQAPNLKTPELMLNWAEKVLSNDQIKVQLIKGKDVISSNLHALYHVGKASENAPSCLVASYDNPSAICTIGFVGKGITFDTGGLSIKGSTNMHFMKCDMAGAAAVLCAFAAIVDLGIPVSLVLVTPFAENVISGNALKPGDVISSHAGKTIEIIDTDAEGRLILADALSFITCNYKPDVLIDMATLTGSSVATLGYEAAAMFTKNDLISELLYSVGYQWDEKVWRFPLWDQYREDIESDIADYRNFSGKPIAGAITAAMFLQEFTNNHPAWVHLDIAGVSFKDSEFGKMRNATAYGVKLLVEFTEAYTRKIEEAN